MRPLLFPLVALLTLLDRVTLAAGSYDVVVVGSGPGGLVAAEYLSRNPSVKVLVLEAGGPSLQESGGTDGPEYAKSKGWTKFDIPGEYDAAASIFEPENAKYKIDYVDDRTMYLGQLIGGCSSINAALYLRTPDSYVTNTQWPFSPAHVSKLFDEIEKTVGTTDKPSTDGKHYLQEAYTIVAQGLTKQGYSEKSLNDRDARNNKSKTFGHAPFAIKNGLRDAPAKTFYSKLKTRSNCKVLTFAKVQYLQQSKGKVSGVVYVGSDKKKTEVALSKRGVVIMAAGALGTPRVLIQSGIGPRDQLELLQNRDDFPGINESKKNDGWVINDNVGKGLFDTTMILASFSHPGMKSFQFRHKPQSVIDQYLKDQSGPLATSGPLLLGYENYDIQGREYEFQITVLPNGMFEHYDNLQSFTTSLYINNPESRDFSSFNKDGKWHAFTQSTVYTGTKRDLAAMQNYTDRVIKAMEAQGAKFLSANGGDVNDWVAKSSQMVTHHFGGSCYASKDGNDKKRCADDKLRVVGTSNVFVSDASAMRDGTVNPYGFIMYVGREVGGLVEAQLKQGPRAQRREHSHRHHHRHQPARDHPADQSVHVHVRIHSKEN
ncbi:TPA: hypothetical protein N0F65_009843 [Lagenidium giganteum]|uniref:Glucose-methanol-choline oxidoreductase N-terminal domain-containing protein n=1 Tax=Lagenidium giganteum TaxID=4803 RepID=A0AAV2YPU6_9STRA|nr:TPA: hypothetical protein N0F65_009843 [Lagenidium giganteum]